MAQRTEKSRLVSAMSGSLSGACVSAIVQPLDVVRTRMQVDVNRGVHVSAWGTLRTITQESHWTGLWRGTQPTVIRLGLGAGLHFFLLETIKPLVSQRQPDGSLKLGALQAAFAGGCSRAIAAVVSCPITVVKTRMEFGSVQGSSTLGALRAITRAEGVRGLFGGLGPTVLSNAPFAGLYYMFYTRLQSRLNERIAWRPMAVNLLSGTVAAVSATLLTQPFDVVRTQVQLRLVPRAAGAAGAAAPHLSALGMLRHISASQGARGLLAGAVPRVAKRALQTALIWVFYEELMGRAAVAARAAAAVPPK
ncbi:hypothetical protein ACKKBG_A17795 [Auxenochlorella protothecoides x Auxenochlorella symbiontica]